MNRRQRRADAKLQQASADPRSTELLHAGVSLQRAGRLAEAQACYRKILTFAPKHADALHLLGIISHQSGEFAVAENFIRLALGQNKRNAIFLSNLSIVLRDQGKRDEAVAAAREAIGIKPDCAEAHSNLGAALRDLGKLDEAVAALCRALRLKPDYAAAHCNLGAALRDRGKLEESIAAFRHAIRIEPQVALFHFNLGASLQEGRQFEAAVAAYREAIRLKPDYAEAYCNLGATLRELGNGEEAIAALREAVRLRPNLAAAHCNLGAALHDQGRLEEAMASHRHVTELNPDHDAAHGNLGVILIDLGRLDEGRAALERAIQLAPRAIKHRRYLGELSKFTVGEPRLRELEDLAEDLDRLPVEDRIELHFALGKARDDLGRYDEAFGHFLSANALKRQQIAYDEAGALEALDRIRASFTAERLKAGRNAGYLSRLPVFVFGMPRSGTTLVEQILASHGQVFGAGELKEFERAAKSACAGPGRPASYPDMVPAMKGADFHDVGARYVAAVERLAPAAKRIVDKMPMNFLLAGLIHLALPNAVMIHIVRDPRDTCLSSFTKLFIDKQDHTYDLGELGRYYRRYQYLMAHWHRVLPPGRILDVRYEDVVADLEGQARRIVAHCGLAWDPRCLDFHQTQRTVRTASAMQVRQPIYRNSVGRWRAYEPFLGPLLAELQPL